MGKQLKLVIVDDACEPKQGPIAANNVINQKISFVIGSACSGSALGAIPIYNDYGVIMITPSATAPILTDGKNNEFIFRTISRDDQQGPIAAKYIVEKLKPQRIAVLHDKQSYGMGIATAVKGSLDKYNANVVLFEGINPVESDYSSVVAKLKAANIDLLYYGGNYPEMGLLLRQSKEFGFKPVFMSDEGAGDPDITAIAGDASEGMLVTLPGDYALRPENAAIVKAFKDQGRNPHGPFQMSAYAGVQAVVAGINAT